MESLKSTPNYKNAYNELFYKGCNNERAQEIVDMLVQQPAPSVADDVSFYCYMALVNNGKTELTPQQKMQLFQQIIKESLKSEEDAKKKTKMLKYILEGVHSAISNEEDIESVRALLRGHENTETARTIEFVIKNYKGGIR